MERLEFANLLAAAIARTRLSLERHYGQTWAILPRFQVLLNCSHDTHADPVEETVYPEDTQTALRVCESAAQVVDLLWRDGRVPEWIDIHPVSGDSERTLLLLACAGRYASEEPWLSRHPPTGTLIFNIPGVGWCDNPAA